MNCQIKYATILELFEQSVLSRKRNICMRSRGAIALRLKCTHTTDALPRCEVPLRATLKSNVRRVTDVMHRSCENSCRLNGQMCEERRDLANCITAKKISCDI